ncbi:Cof-type HAD-IIB family hydrolase [Helcococcus ovis]|uniref:Cof-type HAD-IIB family hydrolase n=1 Tax=Helcococcus TaxID=31983 RepID=UPI0038B82D46
MRKLIALDLDGTLLNWRKKITKRTIDALEKAQQQGHVVMIATGRPFESSLKHAVTVKVDKYGGFISNFNGGLITNIKTNEIISDTKFEINLLKEIIEFIDELCVDYSILHDKNLYTNYHSKWLFRIYRKAIGQNVIKDDRHFDKINFSVNKILLNDSMKNLKITRKLIEEKFKGKLEISFSSPVSIEITPANTSKGRSVLKVAEKLGIPREDTIAFGNYGNDISMITLCGTGVAMKNSSKELINVADNVTDTNNRDGIAKYLEKYVLK